METKFKNFLHCIETIIKNKDIIDYDSILDDIKIELTIMLNIENQNILKFEYQKYILERIKTSLNNTDVFTFLTFEIFCFHNYWKCDNGGFIPEFKNPEFKNPEFKNPEFKRN